MRCRQKRGPRSTSGERFAKAQSRGKKAGGTVARLPPRHITQGRGTSGPLRGLGVLRCTFSSGWGGASMYVFKLFAKLRQIFGMCKSLGHNLAHDVDARYEVLYGGAYLYARGVVYCIFFRKKIKKSDFCHNSAEKSNGGNSLCTSRGAAEKNAAFS